MYLKMMTPMLNVSNIENSINFYHSALGFDVVSEPDAITEWRWAIIRSGDTELMLSETDSDLQLTKGIDPQQSTQWPAIYYFYPDDVENLYQQVKSRGFQPTELITTLYGMREFSLQDPDGHMLSFGEDATA